MPCMAVAPHVGTSACSRYAAGMRCYGLLPRKCGYNGGQLPATAGCCTRHHPAVSRNEQAFVGWASRFILAGIRRQVGFVQWEQAMAKQQKARLSPGFLFAAARPGPLPRVRQRRYQAAMPLWRSRASMFGSRPRKARKFSAAGRLPPRLMISARKRWPVAASCSSPASSNAA